MKKKLVSVILVVKNGKESLIYLINSLIIQKYRHIELIVIDGGSTDGTVNIIKDLCDGKLNYKIFENPNEINIVESYQLGFKMSCGEYIITIGHDDFLDERWVERAVSELDKNESIHLVWGRSLCVDHNFNLIVLNPPVNFNPISGRFSFLETIAYGFIPIDVNSVIRRNVFALCFPHQNSNINCEIYTPHLFFFIKFYNNNFIAKFINTVSSTSISSIYRGKRRQELFFERELKCTKKFYKILFNIFLNEIFNTKNKLSIRNAVFFLLSDFGKMKIIITYLIMKIDSKLIRILSPRACEKIRRFLNLI